MRGGYTPRGARASWASPAPPRHVVPQPSPSPNIPTGPRYPTPSAPQAAASPSKFPPPAPARPTLAQSLWSTMPPVLPGGKIDQTVSITANGVTRDLEPHMKKLKEEEERLREELRVKQERLGKSLQGWDKLGREARMWQVRSDLSEKSLRNLAGDGSGAAF